MTEPTITYSGYTFTGPFLITTTFNEVAGVYMITNSNGTVIDAGETDNLKIRIPSHERQSCWTKNDGAKLYFHREDNEDRRLAVERIVRNTANPVCGVI